MDAADRAAMNAQEAAALIAGWPFAERLDLRSLVVVAADAPTRVEYAAPGALALFGVDGVGALAAVALSPTSPGARRLRRLLETLAPGAPPRAESLRFYPGRLPLHVELMCARLASPEGRSFLIAAAPAAAESGAPPPAPASEAAAPPVEIAAPRRFLFALDVDDRFGEPDRALVEAVGDYAPKPGETLAALSARVGLDAGGEFAAAVGARRTFSALRLAWPAPDRAGARIALMSGAPRFDGERRFAGFAGFGLLTDETVPFEAPSVPTAADNSAPATPPAEELAPPPAAASAPPPAAPVAEPAPSPPPEDRGGEIVLLRQLAAQPASPNVVPLRPGAANAVPPPRGEGDERDAVELTSFEREAFREIARALGAKLPLAREDKPGGAPPPATAHGAPDEPDGEAAERDAFALLDQLPIAAMVLRGGEPIYLNQTMLDLAGYCDLAAFRAADALTRMFKGRDAQMLAEASDGGAIPVVAADGEAIVVDGRAQPIQWRGAPATLIALRRSLSAEREAELRALEREARAQEARARDLAAALDAAADGVVSIDAGGRILALNRGAEALFGYDRKEVAGESFLMLFAPQSQGEAADRFERLKQGEAIGADDGELVGRDRRGQARPLAVAMGRLAEPPAPPRFCVLTRDLTQTKASERALEAARKQAEEANARKTDFLARVSHEVRTPLHAILGFAEVMLEERFGPIGNDRYKDYIKDIHASAEHVVSLADDLLDLSKIEAGKLELVFAPVDVNRVIRECVSLMQPQAAQERVIMRLSLLDKLPNVMADERSLRQILLNLMSNAVKYNEPGGQVIVSTALDDAGHAVVRVRDTGVGMNESEITAALEPFRQIAGARRADGAGLGLPLTKALAEANHADFSIKSRKEQGTLVEVAFPSVKAAQ